MKAKNERHQVNCWINNNVNITTYQNEGLIKNPVFVLCDGNEVLDLSDCTNIFYKSIDTKGKASCVSVNILSAGKGEVELPINGALTENKGVSVGEIVVQTNEGTLSFGNINIITYPSVENKEIEKSDNFTALTEALSKVANLTQEIAKAKEEINKSLNEMSTKIDSDSKYNINLFKEDSDTDDTQAIIRAINKYNVAYLPSGSYNVTSIVLTKSCTIYGDGVGKTIINAVNSTEDDCGCIDIGVYNGQKANNVIIRDLSIKGTWTSSILSGKYRGIRLRNTTNSIIENIDVNHMSANGIEISPQAIDCKFNNVVAQFNRISGIVNQGFGCSLNNIQTSQNYQNGFSSLAGGLLVNNLKTWGNKGHGLFLSGKAKGCTFNNMATQQNGGNGVNINGSNCIGNVITGLQSIANNFNNNTYNSSGLVIGGKNNYISGTLISSSNEWNSAEKVSVKIEDYNTRNNIVDVSVTDSFTGDLYDNYMNNDNFSEATDFVQVTNNPFNSIKINGIERADTGMTNVNNLNDSVTSDSSGKLLEVATVTDNGVRKTSISNCKATVVTLDEVFGGNNSEFISSKVPLKIIGAISDSVENFSTKQNVVLYIKLTAKISDFKKWGLFITCQYTQNDSTSTYRYVSENTLDNAKNTIILGSNYETKVIAIDFGKSLSNNTQLSQIKPIICVFPLTSTSDCDITIKEFSYKLCEKSDNI